MSKRETRGSIRDKGTGSSSQLWGTVGTGTVSHNTTFDLAFPDIISNDPPKKE